jgi:preprotein translocase subunit SecY
MFDQTWHHCARQGEIHLFILLALVVIVFTTIAFVVFIERGQRRIVVNYAKRQQGRKVFAAQSTHLPLKLNMSGVIPAIFASSVILFPGTIAQWFGVALAEAPKKYPLTNLNLQTVQTTARLYQEIKLHLMQKLQE